MRRAASDNQHSAPPRDTMAASSRTKKCKQTSLSRKTSDREKKRHLCYTLVVVVFFFQGFVYLRYLPPTTYDVPPLRAQAAAGLAAPSSDGTFNGFQIYLKSEPFDSTVHCVGETHDPKTAWMYRSCEFTNLCLDTESNEFYVVESEMEKEFQQHRIHGAYLSTELSSAANLTIALGGVNPRWAGKDFNQGVDKVRWFPKIVSRPPSTYYALDPSITVLPFHSFAAHNVGHLLWDDFLPIFTLLEMFGWENFVEPSKDAGQKLSLLRVDTLPLLYGTCEMRRKKAIKCAENFQKFLPLLGVDPSTFSTVKEKQFRPDLTKSGASWVCAKHAFAGMGMLTDHGLKDHGWRMPKETHSVQNTAKGALLYRFRNMMVQNLGLPVHVPPDSPFRIVLSAHSSGDPGRDVHFLNQQNALRRALPHVAIDHVELAKLGMREQVELISQTQIFVSTCGGGSMTATFLPKGASLILYYDEVGGYDFANNFNMTGDPAMLDWDLFNNMAHLRVHWLPLGTMSKPEGLQTLLQLVSHEIKVMESGL